MGSQVKGKNYYVKKIEDEDGLRDRLDDIKEACSRTEERKLNAMKGKIQTEVVNIRSPRSPSMGRRKRSRPLFGGGMCSSYSLLISPKQQQPKKKKILYSSSFLYAFFSVSRFCFDFDFDFLIFFFIINFHCCQKTRLCVASFVSFPPMISSKCRLSYYSV